MVSVWFVCRWLGGQQQKKAIGKEKRAIKHHGGALWTLHRWLFLWYSWFMFSSASHRTTHTQYSGETHTHTQKSRIRYIPHHQRTHINVYFSARYFYLRIFLSVSIIIMITVDCILYCTYYDIYILVGRGRIADERCRTSIYELRITIVWTG